MGLGQFCHRCSELSQGHARRLSLKRDAPKFIILLDQKRSDAPEDSEFDPALHSSIERPLGGDQSKREGRFRHYSLDTGSRAGDPDGEKDLEAPIPSEKPISAATDESQPGVRPVLLEPDRQVAPEAARLRRGDRRSKEQVDQLLEGEEGIKILCTIPGMDRWPSSKAGSVRLLGSFPRKNLFLMSGWIPSTRKAKTERQTGRSATVALLGSEPQKCVGPWAGDHRASRNTTHALDLRSLILRYVSANLTSGEMGRIRHLLTTGTRRMSCSI